MGLDTSYNAWNGGYGSFRMWRARIATVAGYRSYDPMFQEGFTSEYRGRLYGGQMPNWDALCTDAHLAGDWDEMPIDPLMILLVHYDCDGHIKAEHCEPLADRLEELMPYLHGTGGGHIGLYRKKTQTFIDGLRAAVADGEGIEFF